MLSRPSSICAMNRIKLVQAYTDDSLMRSAAKLARARRGGMQSARHNIRKARLRESVQRRLGGAARRLDDTNQFGRFDFRRAHHLLSSANRLERHPERERRRNAFTDRRVG